MPTRRLYTNLFCLSSTSAQKVVHAVDNERKMRDNSTNMTDKPSWHRKELSRKHKIAALLEARGELSVSDIADEIGLQKGTLYQVRTMPEYKLLREHYQRELAERTLDESAELLSKFNREAPNAFETLASLHKRADRDSVRRQAAVDILERATVAPSRRSDTGSRDSGITIQIGVQTLNRIESALSDVGDNETIALIEADKDATSPSYVKPDISNEE